MELMIEEYGFRCSKKEDVSHSEQTSKAQIEQGFVTSRSGCHALLSNTDSKHESTFTSST